MPKFPADAPNRKVIKALQALGFRLVREGNHIAMVRVNPDGTSPCSPCAKNVERLFNRCKSLSVGRGWNIIFLTLL